MPTLDDLRTEDFTHIKGELIVQTWRELPPTLDEILDQLEPSLCFPPPMPDEFATLKYGVNLREILDRPD